VADTSLSGMRIGRELDTIIAERGRHGTVLTGMAMLPNGTTSAPGKPQQNAFVESFDGRLRDELLNLCQAQRYRDATGRDAALTCGLHAPSRCTTEPDRLK
jgi:hypothetical protein